MAKIATLTDTFTTKDTTLWSWGSAPTVSSGKAHFAPSDYVNCIATTWATYDLTSSSIIFNFNAVQSTASGNGPFFDLILHDTSTDPDTGNRVVWHYEPTGAGTGNMVPRTIAAGGSPSDGTAFAYSATATDFLKISDNGTNIIWESSPDGTTWTTRRTLARPGGFTLTAMYVSLRGTNDVANTGSFDVDAVNPTIGPQTYAASTTMAVTAGRAVAYTPSSNALGAFTDEFDNAALPLWTKYGAAAASGGNLVVPSNGWGFVDNGVVTASGLYNMTGSQIVFDLGAAPLPTPNPESILELGVSSTAPNGTENRFFFSLYHTTATLDTVTARYRVAGVDGDVAGSVPRQRFLRMRHVAPNIVWDSSADGSTWSTAISKPTSELFAITSLYAWILAKGAATGNYSVAAVNPGVAAAPTAPTVPQTFAASNGVQSSVLTWTAPATTGATSITGYEVTWTPGGTTAVPLGNVLTYTATGLTENTAYTFSVKAKNNAGLLSPAATATATPTAPAPTGVPGAPTSVTATAGNASAVVSWTAPGTTNGTILDYSIVDQNGTARGTVTGTSTTVSGLTNGMQYTFRVTARNATGSSVLSVASNTVQPSANPSGALYSRSTLGAAAPDYNALESVVGQALQPVVLYVKLTDTPASIAAKVTAANDRSRRVLLMLSIAGVKADQIRTGGANAQLAALGTALAGTGVPVFVAPLYEGNDWKQPWSPQYGSTSPGYDALLASDVGSTDEYKQTFDRIVRVIRGAASLARFVWVASVEDQPSTLGDDWASLYPGAVTDVIMLKGFNYGNGPAQGGGATVWQTASEIFDTPYATAAALHASKPIWLYTASHEPSATYAPVGPGFSAGATMSIDSTHSKATWLTDLLGKTTWPRVTSVALYGISDTRNWSLTSTTGASSALSATIDHSWALTQITQDQMGDYVRDSTAKFATWLRSGSQPATRTNEYARPDAAVAGGTRGSLVFGLPYSPGEKTSVSITVADMLKWNTIHGELLRQCARNGMQGWAFGSGVMAPSDPMTLYGGSNVGGRTVLESANDPQPGPKMQVEGGQKAAEGGTIVTPPTSTPAAPSGALVTTAATGYDSAQTQLQLDWAPPTQLNGSTLTGYKFFASGPGAFTPEWVSGVYDPPGGANPAPDPFIFTNMVADTTYTVGVVAVSNNGDGARRSITGKTAVAPPPPPPSASGLPNPLRGVYHMTHIQNAYNDSALARFNFFFHSFAHGRSSDGFIPNEAPSEANGYKGVEHIYSGMKAHIDALDAETPSRKVVLSIGGAGDSTQCTLATELTMFNSLVTIIDTHGFKGVDFDLEAAANYSADGLRAVSARLKKKYGGNFTITCAPGPNNATYRAFAATPAGWSHPTAGVIYNGILCDAIMPQFYDWSATDASRKQSMYDEVNAILALGVPASRIVIGGALPWGSYLGYNCDSCPFNGNGTGGNAPQVFIDAYNTLKNQSKQIRGLFIWDSGHDQNPSNWSTATTANNLGSSGSWKFRDALWTNLPNP